MDKANSSYRERAKNDRKRAKRFKAPDTTKMWCLNVPDPNISGKYTQYYFSSKAKRDKRFKDMGGIKIDPT